MRAALALNWSRTGGEKFFDLSLIAFLPVELEATQKEQTSDKFVCHWAQRNHWNLLVTTSERQSISQSLANRRASPKSFTTTRMKRAGALLRANGCRSVLSDSNRCICQSELDSSRED
jgi:hypothetical protein